MTEHPPGDAGGRLPRTSGAGRADQRRNDDRIVRAASRLLAADPGTTMQDIADAAGVTRLSVYRRFPNRQALQAGLRAAVQAEADAVLAEVERLPDADVTGPLVLALVRLVRHHPLVLRRHAIAAEPFDQRLAALLARGQAAGVLRPDVPPEVLNAMLFAVLATLHESSADLDDEAAASRATTLLLDGLRHRP